mmetsp:Transcript_133732/g.324988  ORF Transcript_133732/g.324988 Transcript_133732/m.324988 type:complete len:84 (-) Transcript_133732:150-401(-)
MDVKYLGGKLEVRRIFPDGAVQRCNAIAASKHPPTPVLQAGDIIHSVNDVSNSDIKMISEIRLKAQLVLSVARPVVPAAAAGA